MTGWPFWAATSDERIESALDLADLKAGEQLIDLGCGDGRVLLRAAAFRDAHVTGIEVDAELAAKARDLLREHGVEGRILEGDFRSAELEVQPDVVFAYLSPATLQRLRPRLAALPVGTRVVTAGYAVPGWLPDKVSSRCFLYRIPAQPEIEPARRRGWATEAVLVAVRPDAPSLVAVKLFAESGRIRVEVDGPDLAAMVTPYPGSDRAEAGETVVVDLRFEPRPAGSIAVGALTVTGSPPLQVLVVVHDGEPGMWGLSGAQSGTVAERLVSGQIDEVLAEARAAVASG